MQTRRTSTAFRMALRGALVSLVIGFALAGQAQEVKGPVYALYADGLACPFCAYGIEKQLSKIKGVEEINTDISTGTITITMIVGAKLDETTARQAVEAAAFTLRDFKEVRATGHRQRKE